MLIAAFCTLAASAGPVSPAQFAATSRLAQGHWAKVKVSETGIQLISNSTLKTLGFSDPGKVNVYGFGGAMLSEQLNDAMPDDLPLLPSIRTSAGIVFFGVSDVKWEPNPVSSNGSYRHTSNPYSEHSYYFISDCDAERPTPEPVTAVIPGTTSKITHFTERLVHERDLLAPDQTGRLILGEDFRTQSTRNFTFSLPGIIGEAQVYTNFGAKVSNGSSTLSFQANGTTLKSSSADKIPGIGNSECFLVTTLTNKRIENPGEKLNLAISYSNTGALFTAALDYIKIEYERELRLVNNELYFYFDLQDMGEAHLEGCSEDTRIWDVTNPITPQEADFILQGTTAIVSSKAGYSEFVAFNPEKVSRQAAAAGVVANQDLHGDDIPDMVVIAPDEWRMAALRIADIHKKSDGIKVAVYSPQQIYNEFSSGTPDVTAFRKLLKMWHVRASQQGVAPTGYCLLFGRPSYDNKLSTTALKASTFPRIPIWQSPTGLSETTSYSTDDYIGMLEDNLSELNMNSAKINVAVGRMPVTSPAEANDAAAKLENYVLSPELGQWRNKVMIIADDQDNGDHLNQAERVVSAMGTTPLGNSLLYEKIYLDAFPLVMTATGAQYPAAKNKMMKGIDEGLAYINYSGHGNTREWSHERFLTWEDIMGLKNKRLPFLYAATCHFLYWDADNVSGGEEMWLNPTAGVIGMLCPSRKVYISLNGTLNARTAPFVTSQRPDGTAMRIGDFMREGKNLVSDNNRLRYCLMGDPAMALPFAQNRIVLTHIAGKEISANDLPVLEARSRVKVAGRVTDPSGNPINDFNGELELQLFDAEKPVDTFGHGDQGTVITFNNRTSRLFTGRAKVTGGLFETEIIVPPEIENNYSPGLLSLYACETGGRQASGSSSDFYVYGYNENAAPDTEGPVVRELYLNNPSFTDGASVRPASTLYAQVSDSSGINLSDAGIGHKMTITIDGVTTLDDVALYFTPDAESLEKGEITYPLPTLEPGEHNLKLTVWDNANNSTRENISFKIMADWKPSVTGMSAQVTGVESVAFVIETDGDSDSSDCIIEIFDLAGRKLNTVIPETGASSGPALLAQWNMRDLNNRRVQRGIYIARATITTLSGAEIRHSLKFALPSPSN